MSKNSKQSLTAEEKNQLIDALTAELPALRAKAEVSQETLAELIGVSRQTYGSLERGSRRMSWPTFLSLVLYFSCNKNTRRMLWATDAIPQDLLRRFNAADCNGDVNLAAFLGEDAASILDCLDEQAIQSIRTMIMLEYARCTSTPGDVILKSFDGTRFVLPQKTENLRAEKALRAIKEQSSRNEQP